MLAGGLGKSLLIAIMVALVLLLLMGFVIGAVGAAIREESPYVPQPEIHLPPQPVFPTSKRDLHLGLSGGLKSNGHDEVVYTADDSHGASDSEHESEHHSTPLGINEFAVTNTMLSAWFASLVLIVFFVLGSGRRRLIPGRMQGLVETLFEAIINFSSGVLGADMARKAFPIVATIFFFVLFLLLLD